MIRRLGCISTCYSLVFGEFACYSLVFGEFERFFVGFLSIFFVVCVHTNFICFWEYVNAIIVSRQMFSNNSFKFDQGFVHTGSHFKLLI